MSHQIKHIEYKMLLGREIDKWLLRLKIQHMLKYHKTVTHQGKKNSVPLRETERLILCLFNPIHLIKLL